MRLGYRQIYYCLQRFFLPIIEGAEKIQPGAAFHFIHGDGEVIQAPGKTRLIRNDRREHHSPAIFYNKNDLVSMRRYGDAARTDEFEVGEVK